MRVEAGDYRAEERVGGCEGADAAAAADQGPGVGRGHGPVLLNDDLPPLVRFLDSILACPRLQSTLSNQ